MRRAIGNPNSLIQYPLQRFDASDICAEKNKKRRADESMNPSSFKQPILTMSQEEQPSILKVKGNKKRLPLLKPVSLSSISEEDVEYDATANGTDNSSCPTDTRVSSPLSSSSPSLSRNKLCYRLHHRLHRKRLNLVEL